MNAQEMWETFTLAHPLDVPYDTWAFGENPDALAGLVLRGAKTATASACPLYAAYGEPLPKTRQYSVILNSHGEAVCIIKTERVYVVPFDRVDQRHAAKEGEGDCSLRYWRTVHEAFFTREMNAAGLEFDSGMDVLCEEFQKVYP